MLTMTPKIATESQALEYNACDIDSIIAIYNRLTKALPQLMPIKVLQGIPELKECVNKASDYDSLIVLKVVGINAEI